MSRVLQPTGDLILIAIKGLDMSHISDAAFDGYLDSGSARLREQIEPNIYAAWVYNAKIIHYNEVYRDVGFGFDNTYDVDDYDATRAQVFDSPYELSLGEDFAFSDTVEIGEAGMLPTRQLNFDAYIYPGEFFYHKENWYFTRHLSTAHDDPDVTHSGTIDKVKIQTIEVEIFTGGVEFTRTRTRTWEITETFHPA